MSGLPGDRALRLGASWSSPRLEVAQLGLSPALSSFTVCGWYKQDAAPSTGFRLFDGGGNGASAMLQGNGTIDVGVVGFTASGVGSGFNAAGSWVFFAITYENATNAIRVYRGSAASSVALVWSGTRTSGSATASFASGVLNFGNSQGNNRSFAGWMDDLRLYGSTSGTTGALALPELEAVRASSAAGFPVRTYKMNPDDSTAYWEQMDNELNPSLPAPGQTSWGGWGSMAADDPGRQALVGFSSLIENGRLPRGSTVVSARLRLYCNYLSGAADIRLHRMLKPWDETSTWQSMGSGVQADGVEALVSASATATVTTGNAWVEFDVTADVQAWADSGGADNRGWVVLVAPGNAGVLSFRTKEHSADKTLWPELVVTAMPASPATGARTPDAAFFAAMNLDHPGLSAVKTAVQSSNYALARTAYAAHLRSRALPRWFFGIPQPSPSSSRLGPTTTAERTAVRDFTFVGVSATATDPIDWRFVPAASDENWQVELVRHSWFVDLARAWSDTGNSYYTTALASQLRQFIAEVPPPALDLTRCSGYVAGLPRDGWRTIEAGLRCGYFWPDAFLRVVRSPSVSDDDLVEWVKSFVEHARYLEEFHQTASNYAGFESLGIYTVGTLFPEMNEAATWRTLGMQRMNNEMDGLSVYPDGTQMELSPWYHAGMLRYALRMAQLADDQGHPLPATFLPALERMYGYLLHLSTSDNWKVPNLNDSEPMEARSWIQSATRLSDGTPLFPDRDDFAWISSNRLSGSAPDQSGHFFNYSGQAVMRSDWSEAGHSLLFIGGPFGLNGGHSHENKLSIYMAAFGQELLPASGRFLYTFSNPFRLYCLSTRAHSTVMVDGKEQYRRGSPSTYTVSAPLTTMDWKSGALFDYSSAAYGEDSANEKFYSVSPTAVDGTFGVSGPMDAAHRRHILFVKPSYWIVVDDLKPADGAPHTWVSQFHMADFPYSIDSGTNRVTLQQSGRPALTLTPLNENGLTATVVRGAGSEADPANILGWTTTSDGVKSPIPVARFSRTATGRTQIATVLHPTATGATPATPAITRLASPANLCAVRVSAPGQAQIDFVINLDFATSPDFSWGGFSYVNKRHLVLRDGVPVNEDAPSVSLEALRTTLNSNLGQTTAWRLTRFGGDVSQPLTVALQAGGDAVAGTDYQPLPSSVTIPAFVAGVTVPIAPIAPASPRPNRTVSLATPASPDYTVASTAALGISLYDGYAGSGEVVFLLEPGGTGQYVLPIQNTTGATVTYTVGDPGNYSHSSSKQQGGPSLDWQDISTTGNLFDATSSYSRTDDAMSQVSFGQFQGQPFTFPFYGSSFGSVRISTNGFLTFDTSFPDYSSYFNNPLPNATYPTGFSSFPYPSLVALLWDDLVVPNTLYGRPAPNGAIHTQLVDADTFIVQYTNVKPYSQLGNGDERFTGQVVLKRDGRIFLKYKSFNFGQDTATVGIQNGARNKALQLAYNQPFVASNLAVEISPPVPWITTSATSVTAPAGGSGNLTLSASSAGLAAGTEKTYNLTIQPASGNQAAIVVPVRLHVMTPLEAWKANALGIPQDGNFLSGAWADAADPDHDGLPNLVEFALGSNPAAPSSGPVFQWQTDRLTIKFLRARGDVTYIVEGSTDLATWQPVATNPGIVGGEVTQQDTVAPTPRRFLRLRMTSP